MNILLIIYLVSLIICASLMTFVTYSDYKDGEDITVASILWITCSSVIPLMNILISIICIYFILELDKKSWNLGVYTVLIKGKEK